MRIVGDGPTGAYRLRVMYHSLPGAADVRRARREKGADGDHGRG